MSLSRSECWLAVGQAVPWQQELWLRLRMKVPHSMGAEVHPVTAGLGWAAGGAPVLGLRLWGVSSVHLWAGADSDELLLLLRGRATEVPHAH